MTRRSVLISAVWLGLMLVLTPPVAAQGGADRPVGLRWRNRPSIQFGPHVRVDLRMKLAHDWRRFEPAVGASESLWRFRRGGLNGTVSRHLSFQIERDLHHHGRWRDVSVNWETYRQFEVRLGRFKVPFGREELIGIADIDFAARTLASTTIPPARDRGVMVHGRFLRRGFTYEAGVFRGDGDAGNLREPQFEGGGQSKAMGRSAAVRVTGTPLRPLAAALNNLRLGLAYGAVDVPEGLNSLRGRPLYASRDFFEPIYVKGRRARLGVEVSHQPGPFGLSAEWMQARQQRKEQGLGDADLSDVLATGWYTAATWLVTGENKQGFSTPRRPLLRGGLGAVELAARYESLAFASVDQAGPAFRNPRAAHILGNGAQIWTLGVNWFPNRWARVTANAVRETYDDAERTPVVGVSRFWSAIGRVQLVF